MINFCFDKILHNIDINQVEKEWLGLYKKHSKPHWPQLSGFLDFDKQPESFKLEAASRKLDPETHKKRVGFQEIPYPNCTRYQGVPGEESWGMFSQTFPNTDCFRFVEYLDKENISYNLWNTSSAPVGSFYPIAINTYHKSFDYILEISATAVQRLQDNKINLLFFYHEADNPYEIKKHLEKLCKKHNINFNRVYFISGNTEAENIENFYYFFDDEVLYHQSHNEENIIKYHAHKRTKKFTALVRIDKLWRSVFMSTLWKRGLHTEGYFSYNQIPQGKSSNEIACQPFSRDYIENNYKTNQTFLAAGPFRADTLDDTEHNSFESLYREHFENSYCNFVVETHFELEDGNGTTLTEKIVKPICHNQFFIIIGPPHTLKKLRELGYKTFDRCIDESYDSIEDNEERMNTVIELCTNIAAMSLNDMHKLYLELKPEITHNSELFAASKSPRLNDLISKLINEN